MRVTTKKAVYNGERGLQFNALYDGRPMQGPQVAFRDEAAKVEFLKVIVEALWG